MTSDPHCFGGQLRAQIRSLPALWACVVFAIELPVTPAVQARDVSQPDAPLLVRVSEAAKLLNVSRSAMYQLVASGRCR